MSWGLTLLEVLWMVAAPTCQVDVVNPMLRRPALPAAVDSHCFLLVVLHCERC